MELLFSWLIRKRVGSADLDAQAAIKKAIKDFADPRVGVESVRQAGLLGLYEVRVDGKLLYTNRHDCDQGR